VEARHTTAAAKEFNAQVVAKTDEIAQATAEGASAEEIAALTAQKDDLRHSELAAIEWKQLWSKPAIFALLVLVAFVLLFHDRTEVQAPAAQ
jgi:hypothetical protein